MLSLKLVRVVVGVLAVILGLCALALAGGALFAGPRVNWVLLGFEVVMIAAAVMGVLFARGKFQDAPGLALACIAGTVFVAAILGYMGSDKRLITNNGEVPLRWFMLSRVMAGLLIGLLGAATVLLRSRKSLVYLGKAAATGVPVLLAGVAYLKFRGQLAAVPGWASIITLAFGGIIAIVLISASVHLLIRAFQEGKTDQA